MGVQWVFVLRPLGGVSWIVNLFLKSLEWL